MVVVVVVGDLISLKRILRHRDCVFFYSLMFSVLSPYTCVLATDKKVNYLFSLGLFVRTYVRTSVCLVSIALIVRLLSHIVIFCRVNLCFFPVFWVLCITNYKLYLPKPYIFIKL